MKKIVFMTGTRADYGKLKSLMKRVEEHHDFECYIYITGMHMIEKYGSTHLEVEKDGFKNLYKVRNQEDNNHDMSYTMASTIESFTTYVKSLNPDLIVVHGDRLEALAGAIVGAFNNIKVAHIEGGEVTGTIDESIRHSISKFAHIHLVANEEAKRRIIQLGEPEDSIHIIGSPDIDLIKSEMLPTLKDVRKHYDIPFKDFAILMYHPVTTEVNKLSKHINSIVSAIKKTDENYIIIYPNNDLGTDIILDAYSKIEHLPNIKMFPSIRFEQFIVLLKNAKFMIGNSSAGVRETGYLGVPAIDIGTRQNGRYSDLISNIQHLEEEEEEILTAIQNIDKYRIKVNDVFGTGESHELFMKTITDNNLWMKPIQKIFIDYR
jgi:UDP-N-acetylglucosamine 2-epimerase (hydrolysing)